MILHTKLTAGQQLLCAPLERPRLYAGLRSRQQAAQPGPRVVLFVGMAGSGKSIASRHYLEQLAWPAVAIELHPGEPHGWPVIQPALESLGFPSSRPAAAIEGITTPTIFVVDQLEAALDENGVPVAAASPWLAALLANPVIHTVLVSRLFPHIPDLALLAANGHLHIVDGPALAFTADEVRSVWREQRKQELEPEQAALLVERSGGLAAVVALACSMGSPAVGQAPLQELLVQQMISNLPEQLRALLTDTAVLQTLAPSSIEVLTGRSDGAQVLRELRQRSLLVTDRPARLHPLMRDELLMRLRAQRQRFVQLTRLAIDVALAANDFQQAWWLARQAELWDLARELLLKTGLRLRQQGASRTLLEWVQCIPPAERNFELEVLLANAQIDLQDLDGAVVTLSRLCAAEADPLKRRDATILLAGVYQLRGTIQDADELIQPYLDDPTLEGPARVRVYRLHALALERAGQDEEALLFAQQAIDAAQAAGDLRQLGFGYLQYGTTMSKLGRDAEAEQAYRLAERCWREIGASPELASALNNRALLALGRHDFDLAHALAQEARVHALVTGQLRDAALASRTLGDIALTQGHYDEALQHYQVVTDEAERTGAADVLLYSLVLQAHIARLQQSRPLAAAALQQLSSRLPANAEDQGWVLAGIVVAQLTLGVPARLEELERMRAQPGQRRLELRAVILIVLAQAYWQAGQPDAARATWAELEELLAQAGGLTKYPLAPIAAAVPGLLHAVVAAKAPPFASLALAARGQSSAAQAAAAPAGGPEIALHVRVLGTEEIIWQRARVSLPRRGIDLLILLLTTSSPLEDEELLRRLWHEGSVALHALQKLVVRVRALLPGLVRRAGGCYVLGIQREAIDFDLGRLLLLDVQTSASGQLQTLAEAASAGFLVKHDTPWANELRREVARRLALIWLELGRRAEAEAAYERASDAFERAQLADPCSDFVARAAMLQAMRIGDRPLAMQRYLRYRQALDEQLGVEPADDLHALYLQALQP